MRSKFLHIEGAKQELEEEGYKFSEDFSYKEDVYTIYKKRSRKVIVKPFYQPYSDFKWQIIKFFK